MGLCHAFIVFGKKTSDSYIRTLGHKNANKNSNATISRKIKPSLSFPKENKQENNLLSK